MLVEDDVALAGELTRALRNEGLTLNHVSTGAAALHVIATETPDTVILDLGLPDMDGLAVLKRLRSDHPDLPVLLLTARNTIGDKVAGLDSGADDYLAKPFELEELLARLRALGRRMSTAATNVVSVGAVSLDLARHTASVDGRPVELGRREYMLLRTLMENADRVQTRDQLERRLYSWGEEVTSNSLEVHVHHLRKKLGSEFIRTIRGVGYIVASK